MATLPPGRTTALGGDSRPAGCRYEPGNTSAPPMATSCNQQSMGQPEVSTTTAAATVISTFQETPVFNSSGFEAGELRDRLFSLLSKVPIHVETVPSQGLASAPAEADFSQASQQRAAEPTRQPLLIKYYNERCLSELIELHFACSLDSWKFSANQQREQLDNSTAANFFVVDYHQTSGIEQQQQFYAATPTTTTTNCLSGGGFDFVQQEQMHNQAACDPVYSNGTDQQFYRQHIFCGSQQFDCYCAATTSQQQQPAPTISELIDSKMGKSRRCEDVGNKPQFGNDMSPNDGADPLFVGPTARSKRSRPRHANWATHGEQKAAASVGLKRQQQQQKLDEPSALLTADHVDKHHESSVFSGPIVTFGRDNQHEQLQSSSADLVPSGSAPYSSVSSELLVAPQLEVAQFAMDTRNPQVAAFSTSIDQHHQPSAPNYEHHQVLSPFGCFDEFAPMQATCGAELLLQSQNHGWPSSAAQIVHQGPATSLEARPGYWRGQHFLEVAQNQADTSSAQMIETIGQQQSGNKIKGNHCYILANSTISVNQFDGHGLGAPMEFAAAGAAAVTSYST